MNGIKERIQRSRIIIFIFFLAFTFLFRLMYGLFSEFWQEDELQVYLIGLKFYSTGVIPHYGPDVVYTETQLPGALQGLLVGLPFFLLPVPEAPYIFLCLMSFATLCLLALYIRKRTPEIPGWFTWAWIMLCPWTINYSNHIVNPSYVLPAAILFFTGFLETVPKFRIGFIRHSLAMFIMGFALFWIFQLHKSWVLLIPFVLVSLWFAFRHYWKSLLYFLAGCIITGSGLIPLLMNSLSGSGGEAEKSAIVFNPGNINNIFTVLSRYLSFASFELPIFVGSNTKIRMEFISEYYFLIPFIIAVTLIGLAQPVYLTVAFFLKNPSPAFRDFKWLTFLTFLMIWLSFFFSIKGPSSHTFYLTFPVVMIYSFYCWRPLFRKRWFSVLMIVMLFSGIFTYSGIGHRNLVTRSMYIDRDKPLRAIQEKNYHLLGERRSFDRNP